MANGQESKGQASCIQDGVDYSHSSLMWEQPVLTCMVVPKNTQTQSHRISNAGGQQTLLSVPAEEETTESRPRPKNAILLHQITLHSSL